MSRFLAAILLFTIVGTSNAGPIVIGEFALGLLGRSAISRGVVSSSARNTAADAAAGARIVMGRANVAGARGADLTWVGREVAKNAISAAFENIHDRGLDIPAASCLAIEFDGRGNYLANYCNSSVDIAGFGQLDVATGDVRKVGCRGCSIQPGALLYFAPHATTGPFVVAEYRVAQNLNQTGQSPPSDGQDNVRPERPSVQGGLDATVIKSSWNDNDASAILEIMNRSPISIGLVVHTRSIWAHAQATIFNDCGGKYEQWNSPYDTFSGLSKDTSMPTWIPPGGKIIVIMRPNTQTGSRCKLSHLTIDTTAFRPGQSQGQPTPVFARIQ